MDELTDQNLIVINKNAQTAILRDDIERIDARPSGKTRTVNETKITEKIALELRMEALNVFNHAAFAVFSSDMSINSPQFGQVTSMASVSRQMQFGLRLRF